MSDQHDRARLVSGEQRASLEQQDQLMISDEASHMEQRAEKMGQIEVSLELVVGCWVVQKDE